MTNTQNKPVDTQPAAAAAAPKRHEPLFSSAHVWGLLVVVALLLCTIILEFMGHRLYEEFIHDPLDIGIALGWLFGLIFLSVVVAAIAVSFAVRFLWGRFVSQQSVHSEVEKLSGQIAGLDAHLNTVDSHAKALNTRVIELNAFSTQIEKSVDSIRFFAGAVQAVTPPDRFKLVQSLLLLPDDYKKLLLDICAESEPLMIQELTLIGSMAGFSLTLAKELGQALARNNRPFKLLRVIGPLVPITHDGSATDLVCPVWNFQLLVLREFFKNLRAEGEWDVEVESFYVPFDLLAAAIFVPGRYVVALQALSADSLSAIVQEQGYIVGVKFDKEGPTSRSVYERYSSTIDRYKSASNICVDRIKISVGLDKKLRILSSGLVLPLPVTRNDVFLSQASAHSAISDRNLLAPQSWEISLEDFNARERATLLSRLENGGMQLRNRSPDTRKIQDALKLADERTENRHS